MKRNYFILLCVAFTIILTAFSCSDDDESDYKVFPGGTSAKLLPIKIKGEKGIAEYYYEYDADNRLVSKKTVWPLAGKNNYSTLTISYDDEGRIIGTTNKDENFVENNYTFSYSYNDSEITVKSIPASLRNLKIIIDEEGKMLKSEQFTDEGNLYSVMNYEYDNQGNIINTNDSRDLKYDDKNGIFKHVNVPQWFLATQLYELYCFKNNVVEETYRTSYKITDTELSVGGFKIKYTYNENGYPVKYTNPYHSDVIGEVFEDNFIINYKSAN